MVSKVLGIDNIRCSNYSKIQRHLEHCGFLEDCIRNANHIPSHTPQKVQNESIYFHHCCVINGYQDKLRTNFFSLLLIQ